MVKATFVCLKSAAWLTAFTPAPTAVVPPSESGTNPRFEREAAEHEPLFECRRPTLAKSRHAGAGDLRHAVGSGGNNRGRPGHASGKGRKVGTKGDCECAHAPGSESTEAEKKMLSGHRWLES